jgi:hypothetical protein
MKDPYHCPYCSQRSTRRWNLQVHIKRRHGESPDPYLASHSLYDRKSDQFGSATISDSAGPGYIPQLAPLGTSQYSASPIYPPRQIIDDRSYATILPQSAIQKIQEFKALMNKYPKYHNNPDGIIRWAIYNSINGDNTLLDDKLEQLRTIDSLAKFYVGPS